MWELKISKQFKKDLKRYQNKPEQIAHLKRVLEILQESGIVPKEYKPHMLIGEYKGHMECHIENDTLLIWLDEADNLIKLIRFGSHSELFK